MVLGAFHYHSLFLGVPSYFFAGVMGKKQENMNFANVSVVWYVLNCVILFSVDYCAILSTMQ